MNPGGWKSQFNLPKDNLQEIFSFLDPPDLYAGMLTCKHLYHVLEDDTFWMRKCLQLSVVSKDNQTTWKSIFKEEYCNAWDIDNCPFPGMKARNNMVYKEEAKGQSQGEHTNLRSKKVFSAPASYIFEVKAYYAEGGGYGFGVVDAEIPYTQSGFVGGFDYNGKPNYAYYANGFISHGTDSKPYHAGDILKLILDKKQGTLSFFKNGIQIGSTIQDISFISAKLKYVINFSQEGYQIDILKMRRMRSSDNINWIPNV